MSPGIIDALKIERADRDPCPVTRNREVRDAIAPRLTCLGTICRHYLQRPDGSEECELGRTI